MQKLGFNQNHHTFASISLIKIVRFCKFHGTKFINFECFHVRVPLAPQPACMILREVDLGQSTCHTISGRYFHAHCEGFRILGFGESAVGSWVSGLNVTSNPKLVVAAPECRKGLELQLRMCYGTVVSFWGVSRGSKNARKWTFVPVSCRWTCPFQQSSLGLHGYLAQKKSPPPPRTTMGP